MLHISRATIGGSGVGLVLFFRISETPARSINNTDIVNNLAPKCYLCACSLTTATSQCRATMVHTASHAPDAKELNAGFKQPHVKSSPAIHSYINIGKQNISHNQFTPCTRAGGSVRPRAAQDEIWALTSPATSGA